MSRIDHTYHWKNVPKIAPTKPFIHTHTHRSVIEQPLSLHKTVFIDLKCCVASFIEDYIVTHPRSQMDLYIAKCDSQSVRPDIKTKHDMSCLTCSSLQQFAERLYSQNCRSRLSSSIAVMWPVITAGCMVLSMLGVSMGGRLFRRINSGSPCVMAICSLKSHLKRCLPSYIFHAASNTVTGLKSIDLWQTHMLF